MPKIPGLQRKRQTFYLRVRIPNDLLSTYGAKKEIVRSLETRDYNEARNRIHLERAKVQAEFDEQRRKRDGVNDDSDILSAYSEHELQALSLRWFAEALKTQEAGNLADDRPLTLEERDDLVTDLQKDKWRSHQEVLNLPHDDIHNGQASAASYLRQRGISFNTETAAFAKLGQLFSKAAYEMTTETLMRWQGKAYQPVMPMVIPDMSGVPKEKQRTLKQVMDEYMSDPETHRGISTEKNYVIVQRALGEMLGMDRLIHEITREEVKALRDLLLQLPSNATKKAPNKTLQQAAKLAAEKGWPRLSSATVNMYLDKLRSILNFAKREQYLRDMPAEGIKVKETQSKKNRRLPFTVDNLNTIFGALELERATYIKKGRVSRYWIPLISLYTGMRLNEICQLEVADIEEKDGITVVWAREEGDSQLKTDASERYIPLHPVIKSSGFLEYVSKMRDAKVVKLFPELEKDVQGYYSGAFSKWFGRVLKTVKVKKRQLTFHSFRHNFRDALRKAHTPRDVSYMLGGWSQGEVADDYGWGEDAQLTLNAQDLYEAICKVTYPDVKHDFSAS